MLVTTTDGVSGPLPTFQRSVSDNLRVIEIVSCQDLGEFRVSLD